jgi:asparagine synthase (glutamine-hydrolysing)
LVIEAHGEPFSSTSMYAQWRVFRAAREAGIKVMVDGQGADELLGGYAGYRLAQIGAFLRRGRWPSAFRLWRYASSLPGQSGWWTAPRVLRFLLPESLRNPIRQCVRRDVLPSWLNDRWFRERGVRRSSESLSGGGDLLRRMLHETLTHSTIPHLLRSEDRNSMAFSIESRVPFLTPKLAAFLLALPEEYLVSPDGTSKAVFRRAMRGLVPDAILDRRDKLGFPTPERQWLLHAPQWVERVLGRPAAESIGALNMDVIRRDWRIIQDGKASFDSRVWRWVNLLLWAETFSVDAA